MTRADLFATARHWRDHDPDPSTRAVLTDLIDAAVTGDVAAADDLAARFHGPLTFGTAGLRGEVGAGESRMNVAVVTRATAGVAINIKRMPHCAHNSRDRTFAARQF